MRLLLDTHALIWLFSGDDRLTPTALAAIQGDDTRNWVSMASLWEIAIKSSLGKLRMGESPIARLIARIDTDGLRLLHIDQAHCGRIAALPMHHRDPFDRMLIVQAQEEGLSIVSADPSMDAYGVERIW